MNEHSPARRLPWMLAGGSAALALWSIWMGWYGLPYTTSDSPCFKQPAYMRLFTPNYSIPSYEGRGPFTDLVNCYPSAMYTYANYLTFKVFGFSQFTSIAVDLVIHFALSAAGAWTIWRLTNSQLAGLVFLLGSMQWLLPAGRPEELGILLVFVALITLERGRLGLAVAIVALGMSGVSSPGAAVVGTVLLVAYEIFSRGLRGNGWRVGLLFCVPVFVSAALYIGYVYPYVSEAWQQERHLRTANFYYKTSLLDLWRGDPLWAVATCLQLLMAMAVAVIGYVRSPGWFLRDSAAGRFVLAAGVAVFLGLLLNIATQRPEYDYRHITATALASLAIIVGWLQTAEVRKSLLAFGLAAVILALSIPAQQMLVRQSLARAIWTEEDVDFLEAKAILNSVVPKTAGIGGDGNAWAMIDDGRPFLLNRTLAFGLWPEYLVSTNWSNIPAAAQVDVRSRIVATFYEEVTPEPRLPCNGCYLDLYGLKIPIARGRCDWYLRIWKKIDPNVAPVDPKWTKVPPINRPTSPKKD